MRSLRLRRIVTGSREKTAINDAYRAKRRFPEREQVTSVAIATETIFLQEDNVVLAAKPGFVAHLAMGGTAARASPVASSCRQGSMTPVQAGGQPNVPAERREEHGKQP
jgi:hypothetical protein